MSGEERESPDMVPVMMSTELLGRLSEWSEPVRIKVVSDFYGYRIISIREPICECQQ